MRFHVVDLPYPPSDTCAYQGKVSRFVAMMRDRGHEVMHYAPMPDEQDPNRVFDVTTFAWQSMNTRVIGMLKDELQPGDFICLIGGFCQKPIADAFPNSVSVEFGVGYGGVFARFKVFESYAWMHTVYGAHNPNPHDANGQFFDAVIPNYFDPAAFPAGAGGDGFAFVGRLIERKGVQIAVDVCRRIGAPLVLAGEGGEVISYGTHVGVVGPQQRAEIMGNAKAVFVPTLYVEPFGGVAAEAMLCGTPVITTDWGAFTETVEQGVDGFRCRSLPEFIEAAGEVATLNRKLIRKRAIARFGMAAVGARYEVFFQRIAATYGDRWYAN